MAVKISPIKGYRHITRDPGINGGEPLIAGTRITVQHIVERTRAGQSVDEILNALPHLTVGQIYAALSYYYDHRLLRPPFGDR